MRKGGETKKEVRTEREEEEEEEEEHQEQDDSLDDSSDVDLGRSARIHECSLCDYQTCQKHVMIWHLCTYHTKVTYFITKCVTC